jgi:hypothetical protein
MGAFMPPVIAGIGAVAGFLGVSSGTLALTLLTTAASVGLSLYQAAHANDGTADAANIQDNFAQAVPGRYTVFGLRRTSGALFWRDKKDGYYYIGIILSDDLIDGIDAFYVNGTEVLLDASNSVTTPPYNTASGSLIAFEILNGYFNQPVSGFLSAAYPGVITNYHTGSGVAYAVCRVRKPSDADFQKIFNSALPKIEFLQRGVRVWDPRSPTQYQQYQSTWRYSTNPALILLYYFTAKNCMARLPALFDITSFKVAADICDQLVQTKTKGLRKRFEMGGEAFAYDQPATVYQRICDTFGGRLYFSNGKFALAVDGFDSPVITITDDMVISIDAKNHSGAQYVSTSIKTRFSSEDNGYVSLGSEASPWVDDVSVIAVGRDIPYIFDLPFVYNHSQAQRLMKAKLYEMNPKWDITLSLDYNGIELSGERVFRFIFPKFGIDQTFRIESLNTDEELGLGKINVHAVSVESAAYVFDALLEEGNPPPLAPAVGDANVPQIPTGLYVRVGSVSGNVRAVAAWVASTSGHQQEAQYKLSSDTVWTNAPVTDLDRAFPMPITGYLTAGVNYDFRVRVTDAITGISGWATTTFTSNGLAGATAPLQYLGATGTANNVYVGMQQANVACAGYVEIVVLPTGTALTWAGSTFHAATQNQILTIGFAETPGTYDVYARSIGVNGDVSTASGPISATITTVVVETGTGRTGSSTSSSTGTGINNDQSSSATALVIIHGGDNNSTVTSINTATGQASGNGIY